MNTAQPEKMARTLVATQITYGIDVAAYASESRMLPLNEDGTLDLEYLVAIANREYESCDLVFEPNWGSESSFRIVSVIKQPETKGEMQNNAYLAEDIAIEKGYYDAGTFLALAIGHTQTPLNFLIQAAKHLCIDNPEKAIDSLIERLAIEAGYSK